MTRRHMPGEPIEGVQTCEWCQRLLVEYPEHRDGFFRPAFEIVEDDLTLRTATESDERLPRCTEV